MRLIGFAVVVILSLFVAPLVAEAQQTGKIARIGFLNPGTPAATAQNTEAFRQGLRELGYVEGKTFVLEARYGEARFERLPELARELVGLKVDVIVPTNDLAIAAVKRETRTIPIVMVNSTDPVGTGFVASLARPGANVTGLSSFSLELSGKRLELLREVVPGLSRVAFLWNPDGRGGVLAYKETEGAARSLRLQLHSVELTRAEDLDRAFSEVMEQRAQVLIVQTPNPVLFSNREQITTFAQRKRLPSIYGGSLRERWRTHVIWAQRSRHVPPRGPLRGQDFERREARRPAGRAADEVRARDQPQDCQGAWADDPAVGAWSSGPGHRVARSRAALCWCASWPSARLPASYPPPEAPCG